MTGIQIKVLSDIESMLGFAWFQVMAAGLIPCEMPRSAATTGSAFERPAQGFLANDFPWFERGV